MGCAQSFGILGREISSGTSKLLLSLSSPATAKKRANARHKTEILAQNALHPNIKRGLSFWALRRVSDIPLNGNERIWKLRLHRSMQKSCEKTGRADSAFKDDAKEYACLAFLKLLRALGQLSYNNGLQ